MGTALSKDRALGALSGGFGAIASETIAEYITPSPEDLYQGIVDDHRKKGIVLTEEGLQKSYTKAIQLRADISRMTTATLLFLAKGDITVGDITGSNALQNNFSSTFASEFGKYAYQYGEDHPEEMEKLNQKISEVEEKIEETLSTEVEFFSHQKKNNLSRIDKNLNILSEENQQKYPLSNYAKENWAQLRKYQQDMRVIEENRTTTVGGLSGEVLLEGGLLFLPMGNVANWAGIGLKGAKEILIKTPYGKELINFSKPLVEKGIQLFEKTRNWVFPSSNTGGMSSVKNFMPSQMAPPFSRTTEALDLGSTYKLRYLPVSEQQVNGLSVKKNSLYYNMGEYRHTKGHHVHAKKAFEGHVNYDPKKAFSISDEFMKTLGVEHQKVTGFQQQLYREFLKSELPNTLEIHTFIALESLVKAGAPREKAIIVVEKSLEDLIKQGVTEPTKIPWKGGK